MTITPPRGNFRRSSERDLASQQARVEEERLRKESVEEQRELQAFESIGVSAAAASVLVTPATMDEVFGDARLYDDFGLVP